MTTLYNEQSVIGTQYQRAFRIVVSNELDQIPRIAFDEETVITLNTGETIKKPCGVLNLSVTDTFLVPLIDPLTGDPVLDENGVQKTSSISEMYILYYSLYIEAARLRDLN